MAITVDVFTKIVDSSLKSSTDTVEKRFTQSGQKAGEEFSKALAAGIGKSPELQRAFDKAADAAGKLRVEQEKLNAVNAKANATDAQKIAQAERVEKAKREEARAVRDAAEAYERLNAQSTNALDGINRAGAATLNIVSNLTAGSRFGGLTAELANMASGFATAGSAAGTMGASMLAAGAIAGGAVVLGLTAVTAGAVELTRELYNLGSEFDAAFDTMQVQTGATGDQLSQLKNIVKDVAGQVPESFGAIADITGQVTQSMELTTGQTEELVTALGHLQHMGVDVDIHSLGMAFKALKTDQDDYVTSLEQALNASQSTGESVDSITGAIESNAGALAAFGFTFGEAVTLITEFDQIGMSPDKGIGALAKAFKALTEAGLEPTKANLQRVFDEIKAFADSGQAEKANEELNSLFGPRGGGLTWLPLIQDGTLNLNDLADAAEAPSTSIQGLADDTYDLSESFTTLGNDIKAGLEPLGSEMFSVINDALKSLGDWFKENKPEIVGFFTFVSTQVINFAQLIASSIGSTLYQIGRAGELLPWVGDKFKGLTEAGQDLMGYGAKLDVIQGHLQAVGDRANTASKFVRDFNGNVELGADNSVVLKDPSSANLASIDKSQYKIENLPDGKVKITAITDEAEDKLQAFVDEQSGVPITMPLSPDTKQGRDEVEQFKKDMEAGRPIKIPVAVDDSGAPIVGPDGSPMYGGGGHFFGARGGSPRDFAHRSMMPFWQSQGFTVGDHAADKYGEHQNGALDVMVPSIAAGKRVLQQVLSDPNVFGAIFDNKTYGYGHGPGAKDYTAGHTGDPTQDHQDHVHIWYKPGGDNNIAQGGMRRWGPMGGFPLDGAGSLDNGTRAGSLLPQGPTYAPGLAPGPVGSTPGVNEYGEPGYYRPDSDSIKSAERSKANADKAVDKAEARLDDLNKDIADLEAKRTVLNSQDTDRKIAEKNKQIQDLQDQIADLQQNAADAQGRVDDAKRGRFTPAKEASRGRSRGPSGQIGADLADDFGISEGLPGMAKWLTTFLANLAFAPAIGALMGVQQASGYDGGSGLIGMAAASGAIPGFGPSVGPSIGPAPLGGSVGSQSPTGVPPLSSGIGTGPAPGPVGTPNTSRSMAASGGGGFGGLGGMPMQAIMAATPALDAMAPGAGIAAQIGIQEANRAAAYAGQVGGIAVSGLLETLLPNNSPLADPGKSWVGRIAGGFAGARPALPNQAGGEQPNPAGQSAKPQTPDEAAALAQNGGGQANGPMVNIENMVNQTPDGGQTVANQLARQQMTMHMSGGPR